MNAKQWYQRMYMGITSCSLLLCFPSTLSHLHCLISAIPAPADRLEFETSIIQSTVNRSHSSQKIMKQKILIKVSMSGQKCRSKAMKIAVGVPGVESAALKGDNKSQIEVIGDGVDAVCLVTLLRKNIGYAELASVSEVKPEKKDDKKENKKVDDKKVIEANNMLWSYGGGMPVFHVQEIRDNGYYRSDPCSIM